MKIQKYHWKYIFFHHQMLRIFIHYDDLKINWQNFETDAWMHDFLGSVRQLDWKLILWGVYCKRWNGQVMEEIMSCIMIDRFLLAKRTSPKMLVFKAKVKQYAKEKAEWTFDAEGRNYELHHDWQIPPCRSLPVLLTPHKSSTQHQLGQLLLSIQPAS